LMRVEMGSRLLMRLFGDGSNGVRGRRVGDEFNLSFRILMPLMFHSTCDKEPFRTLHLRVPSGFEI
jgi:hypothetical protein